MPMETQMITTLCAMSHLIHCALSLEFDNFCQFLSAPMLNKQTRSSKNKSLQVSFYPHSFQKCGHNEFIAGIELGVSGGTDMNSFARYLLLHVANASMQKTETRRFGPVSELFVTDQIRAFFSHIKIYTKKSLSRFYSRVVQTTPHSVRVVRLLISMVVSIFCNTSPITLTKYSV